MAEDYLFIRPHKGRVVYQPDGLGTLRQKPIPGDGMTVPLRGQLKPYYRTALRCGDAEITKPSQDVNPKTHKES